MQRLKRLAGLAFLVMAFVACSPSTRPVAVPGEGAVVLSRLYLDDQGPARPDMPFLFGGREAAQSTISLQSLSRNRLSLTLRCDGKARLRMTRRSGAASAGAAGAGKDAGARPVPPAWSAAETPLRASLAPGARDRLVVDLAPDVVQCRLAVQPPGGDGYALSLESEKRARPKLRARETPATQHRQAPAGPATGPRGDALAAAFHAERALAMTAPHDPGPVRFLRDGNMALNARVMALTGARLSEALLAEGDPTVPLDFSAAPQLDAIYLSYLYLAADFSGALMARMLAWHAERGTVVRILLSDTLLSGPDRALLEELAARHPNVQLQPFRFNPQRGDGAEARAARLHRSNHAKLFVALAADRARSRAIIGGRNWQEAYLFREPRDLSQFPWLRQYFTGPAWSWLEFRPFKDIEVEFTAPDLIDAVAVQFAALWQRDHASGLPFDWPPAAAASTGSRRGHARHFVSVPWADGEAQERLFVDLFDAANERIEIATPFINPSPAIENALQRALARGVSVRIVTTIDRSGPDGLVVGYLHRAFAREWGDRVALHDFRDAGAKLHAKIFVFDRRLAMITSTNLNRRSFAHDIENGLMVLDRRFAADAAAVIDDFIARGRPVSAMEPGSGLARLLMRGGWLRRVF